jgi:hypothetical protein
MELPISITMPAGGELNLIGDLVLIVEAPKGTGPTDPGSSFSADFFGTSVFTLDGLYTTESGVSYLPASTPVPFPPALVPLGSPKLTRAANLAIV